MMRSIFLFGGHMVTVRTPKVIAVFQCCALIIVGLLCLSKTPSLSALCRHKHAKPIDIFLKLFEGGGGPSVLAVAERYA